MLNYEEFKDRIVDLIKNYLPPEYASSEVRTSKINKNNQILDGMTVMKSNEQNVIVYLNSLYHEYESGKNIDEILKDTSDFIVDAELNVDISEILSPERIKANIFMHLINRANNQELLQTVPYKEYQDLAIVYRINCSATATALVTDEILKTIKMNEDELHDLAVQNTKKLYPPVVESLDSIARELLLKNGVSEEELVFMLSLTASTPPMYAITNTEKMYGAASILYEDVLHDLAEKLESNLYIIPSSLHETLAVSCENFTLRELSNMVQEVNYNEVQLSEQLSNNIYYYNKDSCKLIQATDAPEQLKAKCMEDYDIHTQAKIQERNNLIRNQGKKL